MRRRKIHCCREFISNTGAPLKRRAKAETVSLRAIIYGTLRGSERQKVWSKDLSLTSSRARTDQSRLALRTESTLRVHGEAAKCKKKLTFYANKSIDGLQPWPILENGVSYHFDHHIMPHSKHALLYFWLQVANSANYCGVRWSGFTWRASSQYGFMPTVQ